ncbi:MAG TPA: hypothetical protein VE287_04655 [Actinopolymorphaceae bacterium]|nr:hypothetical protein [Actinopolymorphaceae bacterium]
MSAECRDVPDLAASEPAVPHPSTTQHASTAQHASTPQHASSAQQPSIAQHAPTSHTPTTSGRAPAHEAGFASSPLATLREGRLVRRFVQLLLGLTLYGSSMGLMIRSDLGLDPWDVFHQGLMEHTSLSFGTIVIIVSGFVLLGWIPLRQWPGIGTILNAVVIGVVVDEALRLLTVPDSLGVRIGFMVAGVVLNAVATAAYIGSRLGPGARDGLMTGLVRRTGRSVRLVRTLIELTVLATGWLLGGTVGVGTVAYALGIGPLVHVFLPRFAVRPATARTGPPPAEPDAARQDGVVGGISS